jgi:hypothetical protein
VHLIGPINFSLQPFSPGLLTHFALNRTHAPVR